MHRCKLRVGFHLGKFLFFCRLSKHLLLRPALPSFSFCLATVLEITLLAVSILFLLCLVVIAEFCINSLILIFCV